MRPVTASAPTYQPPLIRLAEVVELGLPALQAKYGPSVNQDQRQALWAITHCRTPACGQMQLACGGCDYQQQQPRSCGHRSCPRCQNHAATAWLTRQRAKLLPVDYFMATFTLPAELREVAWQHPTTMYTALFDAAASTLKSFGKHGVRNQSLQGNLGLCAVLHTHSRRLDYHPHIHVVIPGGAIDAAKRLWRPLRGAYLFRGEQLARVFRARLLEALSRAGLRLPAGITDQWIVDCRRVGRGESALKYLSRYLYRGVLSERNITHLDPHTGTVTFRYVDSTTQQWQYRTLAIADFLWRLLQHVLPKGFRRVRDYGFLHGNAKRWLRLIQLILRVRLPDVAAPVRPAFYCPKCQMRMRMTGFVRARAGMT